MAREDWEIAPGHRGGAGSKRWRQKNKEYPTFVQVSNTFVGDRKPEVNIWEQQKDQSGSAEFIVSGKKFKTKAEAMRFVMQYMRSH